MSTTLLSGIWGLEYNTAGHRQAMEGSADTMITDWVVVARPGLKYKVHGKREQNRTSGFTLHVIGHEKWRVLGKNIGGVQTRVRYYADGLDNALEEAERILGFSSRESTSSMTIAEVLTGWLESLTCKKSTIEGFKASHEIWGEWAAQQGLRLWSEIQLCHLQQYATELLDTGKSENTIRLRLYPITRAIRWAAANWPGKFTDITVNFKLPKVAQTKYEVESEPALSILEVGEFLLWIIDKHRKVASTLALGISLQGLAGLRLTEVFRLTWDKFLDDGTVIIEGEVKNEPSIRRIPLPALVLDLLSASQTTERTTVTTGTYHRYYSDRIRSLMERWGIKVVESKNLRNTLPTEFRAHGWYGYALERYIGHAAKTITDKHYVALSEEGKLQLMREQVVAPIDEILAPVREKLNKLSTPKNLLVLNSKRIHI